MNTIKTILSNILANTILYTGYYIQRLGTYLLALGATIHIKLQTSTGILLKEIETKVQAEVEMLKQLKQSQNAPKILHDNVKKALTGKKNV
jgi:hypothetical protein